MRAICLVATAGVLALAAPAAAQTAKPAKPGKPACGIKDLPLAQGNYWIYETVNQPLGGAPAAPVRIDVVSVATEGKLTTITLKESYRGVDTEMQATCDSAGLVLPAESFFFAGEPGGTATLEVTNLARKGTSMPARGLKPGDQWFEEIKFDVTRPPAEGTTATHDPARVELERLTTVARMQQVVDSPLQPFRSQIVEFEIRGRGIVGEKIQEIPVKEKGILWFNSKVGIARAREISGREWQLVETNLFTAK